MINPDTPFTTWTRSQGYPKGGRSEGVLSINDKFHCAFDDFDLSQLEELEKLEYEGLKVQNSSFEVNENSELVHITFSYGHVSSASLSTAVDGVSSFTLNDGGQEIPVDARKNNGSLWFSNYKANWNYCLAAKKGVTSSPLWWLTATDTTISESEADSYRWVKDASDVPDGWYLLCDKRKRVESFLVPSAVVTETTKYSTYNSAVAKQKTVGSKVTPGKTFGYSGQWLVMSSNVYEDGKKWVCQTNYQNAPEWDSDGYG